MPDNPANMIVALGCGQLRYLKSGAGRTVLDVPNDPDIVKPLRMVTVRLAEHIISLTERR
jgi:hypothetical protein